MKKIPILQGFGQYSFYKQKLGAYFDVRKVDWNTSTITPPLKRDKIIAGFSMGAVEACEYVMTHKVDILILCSLTPGLETLRDIQAKRVEFVVGGKETWVRRDIMRVAKTLKVPWEVTVIPDCDHEMNRDYIDTVLEIARR